MAKTEKFSMFSADYNLMSPEDLDSLVFSGYEQALGKDTRARIATQIENYDYYDGRQHKDELGNLVKASELPRPSGLDYDPTRYATNYFKAVIDRKARWQMSGDHKIHVPRKVIDSPEEKIQENYEPSDEQMAEDKRANELEELLEDLWRENRMRIKLPQAARDRLIADRVVCKIVYDDNLGKLRWIWRPDYEYIPIYSDDDFEDVIACYFVSYRKQFYKREEVDAVKIQNYVLGDDGECYLHEAIYRMSDLKMIKRLVPSDSDYKKEGSLVTRIKDRDYMPTKLDFIPVVDIPIDELLAGRIGDGEISELRTQNDILNTMNEDAIDSLKFEMFPITSLLNVAEGTADKMEIAPGAVIEARGSGDTQQPEVKKVESGFKWKEAFKDQYARVKAAMHEISGLPQIVPQELNFGGLNGEALRILFQDIISDTEEHWLAWEHGLAELHEKSIRYLQARTDDAKFSYDKKVVKSVKDYHTEMKFQLPLPDNRKDLVDLLGAEMMNELESQAGAMERLGVNNVDVKKQEIAKERIQKALESDPYGASGSSGSGEVRYESLKERRNDNGELEVLCDNCGGSGTIASGKSGEQITCPKCKGTGWYQPRKR